MTLKVPHQVDVDDLLEEIEFVGALLAQDAGGPADAGAVDRDPQRSAGFGNRVDRGLDLRLAGDVGGDQGDAVDRCGLVDGGLQVESEDLGAARGEASSGGGTEAGGATGDQDR